MNVKQLRAFLAVAQYLSFAQAGERLTVRQIPMNQETSVQPTQHSARQIGRSGFLLCWRPSGAPLFVIIIGELLEQPTIADAPRHTAVFLFQVD